MTGFTLAELIKKLQADAIEVELLGDSAYRVDSLATLQAAGPHQLSFLANTKYRRFLSVAKAGCVLLSPSEQGFFSGNRLICVNPYLAYAKASHYFSLGVTKPVSIAASATIAPCAVVAPSAAVGANVVIGDRVVIGERVVIFPNVVIGNDVSIGADTVIYPNVTLYHQVQVGCRVVIHSNTVIGADGFGFAKGAAGWVKIAQLGRVIIGDRVEIGACTTIDRGAIEDTVIEEGVIIDNQVQIAHNVRIGKHSAIAGCVGISGSTKIGEHCTVAGAAGFAGHIEIGDRVHIGMQAQVTKSIQSAGAYASGTGLMDAEEWRKMVARLRRFEQLEKRLKKLEDQASGEHG